MKMVANELRKKAKSHLAFMGGELLESRVDFIPVNNKMLYLTKLCIALQRNLLFFALQLCDGCSTALHIYTAHSSRTHLDLIRTKKQTGEAIWEATRQ